MAKKIVVVGANGSVGREVLMVLAERGVDVGDVAALTSERSVGGEVSFGLEDELRMGALTGHDFTGSKVVVFAAGDAVSRQYVPKAAAAGAMAVDCSSVFRMEVGVPLVVPEVNRDALTLAAKKRIIANPGAMSILLAMVLKPLHEAARVKRAVISTYQSVSSGGKSAMDELFSQTRGIYVNDPARAEFFFKQIAFNVIPQIGDIEKDGATVEESGLRVELRKILDPDLEVVATCVQVPVFVGHAASVTLEFENPLSVEDARAALKRFPGLGIVDHRVDGGYVSPVEAVGEDQVFVSRIRADKSVPHGLSLWVVGDNLRKGAALNAGQIVESLLR